MFKHILVATDGSPASNRAAAAAVDLAAATGARVTAFFAAPPATPIVFEDFLPTGYKPPQEHAAMIERMAARILGAVAKLAAKAGVAFEAEHVTSDFPAEAILAAAHKGGCDLICMAPRTRPKLAAMLLGSQTQKVLAQARIPVLIVR